MLAQLLHDFSKTFKSLILRLPVKITVIDLLQDHRVPKVPINQVKSEVRGVDTGFFLIKIQNLTTT